MKALVYTGPLSLELQEIAAPEPGPNEALIRVEAVGICGSDMHAYHGHDSRRPAPLVLGHEAAGRIVGGVRDGERVAVNPLVTCGSCAACESGRSHLCPSRQILSMPPRPGAFADYVCAPCRNLVAIPKDFAVEKAALAEPIAVSWHAVNQGARVLGRPIAGLTAVVLGGGAIGLAAALVLVLQGAAEVLVAEPNAKRRATVERSGPIRAYAPDVSNGRASDSVDLVIDAVGARATRAEASRIVRPGGAIVHVGLLPGAEGFDVRKITLQEIVVSGSYCYTMRDFREVVDALASGRLGALDWTELRSLSDGPRAFADIDANAIAAAKIVLIPP